MSGPRRGASFLWALLLVGATVAVIVGSSPDRARAAASACIFGCGTSSSSSSSSSTSSTSSSTSSTSTTVASPPSSVPGSYTAAFLPCGSTTGPCTQEPLKIQITYPAGPPAAVELAWTAAGRAPGAPEPDSSSVTLAWADGSDCGAATASAPPARCWTWPAGMTADSYVLNGAYQVTACGTATGGTCGSPSTPQDIRVAAPPGDPTHVQARVTGADVGVSWQPPASSPPDLAGYTVARNGRDVYSCSLDGLGPGAAVPCPSTLTFADRPGDGRYTYTVSAVRLGADTASRDTVSSAGVAAAGGAVTVSGPAAGSTPSGGGGRTQTGAGSNGGFTPAPIIGSTGAGVGLDSGAVAAQGLPGAAAPEIGAPGSPENLRYPSDDPVVGHAAPLALKVHTPSGRPDVVPLAALALGVLLLAIAAHLLYLRTELEARRAAPRRGGPLSG